MGLTHLLASGKIDSMDTENKVNLKVPVETRRKLRMIAAYTGEQLMQVIDRLADKELEQLEATQKEQSPQK